MRIKHISFGPFVNESEKHAIKYIRARLISNKESGEWRLLSNISISTGHNAALPREIDILAIGTHGIFVVEVKHWDKTFLNDPSKSSIIAGEAEKLNYKAKVIKGKLKGNIDKYNFIPGKFLLTKNEKEEFKTGKGQTKVSGMEVFSLAEWRDLLELNSNVHLSKYEIDNICKALAPNLITIDSQTITTFNDYGSLKEITPQSSGFRRVYRAKKKISRDNAILVIYDLSAIQVEKPEDIARREYEVIKKMQKFPFIPGILDSYQDAPAYPGEISFFSYIDPESPSLESRSEDKTWSVSDRIEFAVKCFNALNAFFGADGSQLLLHRYLNPETIRVTSKNEPIFTQFHFAKIPGDITVAGIVAQEYEGLEQYIAPEVIGSGLSCCTGESDIYSLCSSLMVLFRDNDESTAKQAIKMLQNGLNQEASKRWNIEQLITKLESINTKDERKTDSEIEEKLTDVKYWDDNTIQKLNGKLYRIISKLGSGSVGSTFKVMEVAKDGSEISGPFVAKAITNEQLGEHARKAYAKVRAQTGQDNLAGILEVAQSWEKNRITALLRWIEGQPLSDLKKVLPLHIEERTELPVEDKILDWLIDLCKGLSHLHKANLVHGDVSPKNILVQDLDVKLTDFDLSTTKGAKPMGGTPFYCSPEVDKRTPITFFDDIFALAASIFDVLFEREPFLFNGIRIKTKGLNWDKIEKSDYSRLEKFMNKATSTNVSERFVSAMEAIDYLNELKKSGVNNALDPQPNPEVTDLEELTEDDYSLLKENCIPRLIYILQSYPSSPKGNTETRGLDSDFTNETYVETRLDEIVKQDILNGKIKLVVLCGNAGDGKTAFLQNLARNLGISEYQSSKRIWSIVTDSGIKITANMDGAASFDGRSAEELLNEFFAPFKDGDFPEFEVRLIAINDGPLLAWLDQQETTGNWLTEQLENALNSQNYKTPDERICFVNFNYRSLVGGYQGDSNDLNIEFLKNLIDKIIGSPDEWKPCSSCLANKRCTSYHSVNSLTDGEKREGIIKKLARALQAVHIKGDTHITARSLRAALSYIFFGWHSCDDLHQNPDIKPLKYWDRVFDCNTEFRQGELLDRLANIDPALEVDPSADGVILNRMMKNNDEYPDDVCFDSLKRMVYFEGFDEDLDGNGKLSKNIDIYQGKHVATFIEMPKMPESKKIKICDYLCMGIAKLEDLPENAFFQQQVPLRITPRTPTETSFWVNKPINRFSLSSQEIAVYKGIETLHNELVLKYSFENGHKEELAIGADLFHILMEVKDGYQLSGGRFDDVFANLSIFKQRLAQEEETVLFASNPMEEHVCRISIEHIDGKQKIVLTPIVNEESGK